MGFSSLRCHETRHSTKIMVHHPECTKLIRLEPESSVDFLLDTEGHQLSNVK
jgi:hypothetical protein